MRPMECSISALSRQLLANANCASGCGGTGGVSRKVTLGVRIIVAAEKQLMIPEHLKSLLVAENIVHLAGDELGLSAWFSGQRLGAKREIS
jgi:hypothetical protein